jgi:twinkle protein
MTILAAQRASIVEALADVGLRPKRFTEETQMQMRCPKCHGGSEAAECLTLKIDKDGKGAVWFCHRAKCGWSDNLLIPGERRVVPFSQAPRTVRTPDPVPEADRKRTPALYEFFSKRGISQETVDYFGCYQTTHWFRKKGDHAAGIYPAIVFPYIFDKQVVNRKYRSVNKQLMQEKDPLHTLFNIDSVEAGCVVVWVEGETDCMAVHEAGWRQVVSLKDGAADKVRAEDDPRNETDRRYEALKTHADMLDKVDRFILAGDMDVPGLALREELARRLGRNKCWLVNWPEGCKDACEVMQTFGEDVVKECLHAAKPYPIEDVQEITGEALAAYLARPAPRVMTTGITALDQAIKIPAEGRLIVMTGVPNAGKSQLMLAVMMHLMLKEDRRFLVFSPEMQPWEEFCVQAAQVLIGKPARRGADWEEGHPLISVEEQVQAGNWMHERMRFLSSDAEDKAPTLEWILDRGHASALRLGITDLLIDPWNEIEHQSNGMTETDYTGRALQKIKAFGYRHGVNAWIVVHPTKMRSPSLGEPPPAPGPYDISGSANWANKADIGWTVHTPEDTTSVIVWKSRFARWGRKNAVAQLEFEKRSGRYGSPYSVQAVHGPDAWNVLS